MLEMFIIERTPNLSNDAREYSTAYELVGTKEELETAHQQATSLSLAALYIGKMRFGEASDFLEEMGDSPVRISKRYASTLRYLMADSEDLTYYRREQLLKAGAKGTIGALAISQELLLLNHYKGFAFDANTTTYVNQDGVGMKFEGDDLVVSCNPLEEQIEDRFYNDDELAIIKSLSQLVTHGAWQYEVPEYPDANHDVSRREHRSLGTIDSATDTYIPYVTILDLTHPAVTSWKEKEADPFLMLNTEQLLQ
jgi:hypothetical protein